MGVSNIEAFIQGQLGSPEADVAVIHAAVGAMKAIKPRADFEVYLKKFLQSLNLILPNPAGHPYRGAARRFGYLLRMVKERYKDDSLDISDAGEKVKALINEHLIDLGINPKIPPVELLSDEFISQVQKHCQGNDEAKASEMEHAIRKHCLTTSSCSARTPSRVAPTRSKVSPGRQRPSTTTCCNWPTMAAMHQLNTAQCLRL